MTVLPCRQSAELQKKIEDFVEVLKTDAHKLGDHGLSEQEFYDSGLFRGAIERLRGQFAAYMGDKREFVRHVLNFMQDRGFIADYSEVGNQNRHDYTIDLASGKKCVIELKGGGDGNNTTIFERPAYAEEFIVWSIARNTAGDPRRNAWSAIHTRLSAEIVDRQIQIDGMVIWDWACGTIARPCPKIEAAPERLSAVGPYRLTPPCLYLFPRTVPSVRTNPNPDPHRLEDIEFLKALHICFCGREDEIASVRIEVAHRGADIMRTTSIFRNGQLAQMSKATPIRRR